MALNAREPVLVSYEGAIKLIDFGTTRTTTWTAPPDRARGPLPICRGAAAGPRWVHHAAPAVARREAAQPVHAWAVPRAGQRVACRGRGRDLARPARRRDHHQSERQLGAPDATIGVPVARPRVPGVPRPGAARSPARRPRRRRSPAARSAACRGAAISPPLGHDRPRGHGGAGRWARDRDVTKHEAARRLGHRGQRRADHRAERDGRAGRGGRADRHDDGGLCRKERGSRAQPRTSACGLPAAGRAPAKPTATKPTKSATRPGPPAARPGAKSDVKPGAGPGVKPGTKPAAKQPDSPEEQQWDRNSPFLPSSR